MIGIYGIYSKIDDELLYIGQSGNVRRRLNHHYDSCGKFNRDEHYDKIIESFDFYDKETLLNREAYWIDELKPKLNEWIDRSPSQRHVEIIRQANLGRHFTEEHKRKISESNKGKVMSEESRRKLSKTLSDGRLKGKNNTNYGKKYSPERCKHISESLKGINYGPEHRRKCSERMMGNTINKGRIHVNKNGINKNVYEHELQSYLDDGWVRGWVYNK